MLEAKKVPRKGNKCHPPVRGPGCSGAEQGFENELCRSSPVARAGRKRPLDRWPGLRNWPRDCGSDINLFSLCGKTFFFWNLKKAKRERFLHLSKPKSTGCTEPEAKNHQCVCGVKWKQTHREKCKNKSVCNLKYLQKEETRYWRKRGRKGRKAK